MYILRRFKKSSSLRVVNIMGLSIVFACMLLSYGYIKRELSYDRHHDNVDRIVRLSLQFNDEPVDGRILGNALDDELQQMPEIERMVKMFQIPTAILTYQDNHRVVNNFYSVKRDFLQVFDLPLLYGDKDDALQRRGQVIISESFARELFGDLNFDEIQMAEISIGGQKYEKTNTVISGIFRDIPETSHFHTDILVHLPDEHEGYTYTYLLLNHQTDIPALAQKITNLAGEKEWYWQQSKPRALLMPLTDIHLHSRNLREMSINGNIHYIYLVAGANLLLLAVVFFNLWLNQSLIFSHSRKYYQLIRISGASSSIIVRDEALLALITGLLSLLFGITIACAVNLSGYFPTRIFPLETIVLSLVFLLVTVSISASPALFHVSSTMFRTTRIDLKAARFSYSNVKYMLTAQYAVVMLVVILAFGIGKQMSLVKLTQLGGDDKHILVLNEQPDEVIEKYTLLKTELMKHPEIESVTAAFQIPGDAIRDNIAVIPEGSAEKKILPIMVAEDDFLSFFGIKPVAGRLFSANKHDYKTHEQLLFSWFNEQEKSNLTDEYIINRKALAVLGFDSPEDVLGKTLRLEHGTLEYIDRGVIVGVTDDFNYTGLFEPPIPMLVMQRPYFHHCIMVRLDPSRIRESAEVFNRVWNEVNTGYQANYTFMSDTFGRTYRNELNAERLVYIFSLLCFIIADLGLIVFMAFIIKRRTKEIGIRKVIGASVGEIVRMLNMNFVRCIALAFVIAVPLAIYIMHRWLMNFAYRTSLSWWMFVLAGFIVLLISFASVSLQSWRAATANPVDAISKS